MIMTKKNRVVEKNDLISPEVYAKKRKQLRKNLIEFKKNRRVYLGPYATFYFECYETMLAQIQEMLYIEKGGDEQLKDELNEFKAKIEQSRNSYEEILDKTTKSIEKFIKNTEAGLEKNIQ